MPITILDIPDCIILEIADHLDMQSCQNWSLSSKSYSKILSPYIARIYVILQIRGYDYDYDEGHSLFFEYFERYPEDVQWLTTYFNRYPAIIPMILVGFEGVMAGFEMYAYLRNWSTQITSPNPTRIKNEYVSIFTSLIKSFIELKRFIISKANIVLGIKKRFLELIETDEFKYTTLNILSCIKYATAHPEYNKLLSLQNRMIEINLIDDCTFEHDDLWEKLETDVLEYCKA